MVEPDKAEIGKMWQIFPASDDSPIALRALAPKGGSHTLTPTNITFSPRQYPLVPARIEAFISWAASLSRHGYNVYTCLNPINPDFMGDMENEIAVTDRDIARRSLMLIDLDRAGACSSPASDAEIEAAAAVAQAIALFLKTEHGIEVFRTMSGNGHHLYLPLADCPNDDICKEWSQRLLKGLAKRFDTGSIKVDTSVYNAARITKVPGTIARKGRETTDRPFRLARVL